MKNEKIHGLVLTALLTTVIAVMTFTSLGYIPLGVINATIVHIPVIIGSLFLGPKLGGFLGFVFGLTSFLNNTFRAATLSAFVFSPVLAYNVVGWTGIIRSALICFVPRILVGVVPYYVYHFFVKLLSGGSKKTQTVVEAVAAAILALAVWLFLNRTVQPESTGLTVVLVAAALAVGGGLFAALAVFSKKKTPQQLAYAYAGMSGAMTNTILVMGGIYVLYKEAYAAAMGMSGDAVINVIAGVVSFNGVLEAVVAAIITVALGLVLGKMLAGRRSSAGPNTAAKTSAV